MPAAGRAPVGSAAATRTIAFATSGTAFANVGFGFAEMMGIGWATSSISVQQMPQRIVASLHPVGISIGDRQPLQMMLSIEYSHNDRMNLSPIYSASRSTQTPIATILPSAEFYISLKSAIYSHAIFIVA